MRVWVLLLLAACYQSHEGTPRDGSVNRDAGRRRDGALVDRDGRVLRDGEIPPEGGSFDAHVPDGSTRDARPRLDVGMPDSGRPSRALSFSAGDFLVVAADPTLELVETWTFELWIRPHGEGTIAIKGVLDSGSYHNYVGYASGEVVVGWSALGFTRHLRAPVTPDRWTHVATVGVATADTVSLRLLIDGVLVATGSFRNDLRDSLNPSNFTFGGFNGDIDEVRLWSVVRADEDIAAAMRRRFRVGLPGMEMYLPLEERGQVALDRALRGHDAVLGSLVMPDPDDPTWITDGPIP